MTATRLNLALASRSNKPDPNVLIKTKTWIEISRSAIEHNVRLLKKLADPAELIIPIKGDAYGHGLLEVAKILNDAHVNWFAVDWWKDALFLRKKGYKQSILLIGFAPKICLRELIQQRISIDVYTPETLKEIIKYANQRHPARIHLEIETGFARQGISLEDLPWFLQTIKKSKHVALEGVFTHFANVEDVEDQAYARYQLQEFEKAKHLIESFGFHQIKYHTASSAALMLLKKSHFDYARPGIAVYGLWPAETTQRQFLSQFPGIKLMPALTWKTIVAQIKQVRRGTPVSYGLTEHVKRDSTIVVIPVGYFDGLDRALSRRGHVLINGRFCKILGRICMNMCMVDATDVPSVRVGDEVVLIGKQKNKTISAEQVASLVGTIHYEIVTRLNPLIPRIIV